MYVCVYVCMYVCIYIYICTYVYIYVHVYMYIHRHIYIYTYIYMEKKTRNLLKITNIYLLSRKKASEKKINISDFNKLYVFPPYTLNNTSKVGICLNIYLVAAI